MKAKEKKVKVSGRKKMVCSCGREFSTYSSNRIHCYECKDKCGEKHCFDPEVRKALAATEAK